MSISKLFTWINASRIQVYPRLMLIVIWVILAFNIIFRNGWQGAFGQIIGGDFIMFYSTGLIYNEDASMIYDYSQQYEVQQALIYPTYLPGLNPYMNPPYVAPVYSLLTHLPLPWAFTLWTSLMILLATIATYTLMHLIPKQLFSNGLSLNQLLILLFSFFPFIGSLQAGQNSGLTYFLMTCLVFSYLKKYYFLSGIIAGLMIYKPQYIIGFLILWLIWKSYKSLLGFVLVAIIWIGTFALIHGTDLFNTYLDLSKIFLLLPYMEGFPGYILVTLYGFLTTIFPFSLQPSIYNLSQIVFFISCVITGFIGYRLRNQSIIDQTPALAFAIVLPIFSTPYALVHDLVLLIPCFVLLSHYYLNRDLLLAAIIIYIGTLFLTFAGILSHIALNALLVIGLVILIIHWEFKARPLIVT